MLRVLVLAVVALAAWGAFAASNNASSGTPDLPLGPIGSYGCESAANDAHAAVPHAIAEAQAEVNAMIAEYPELAPYAADARRILAESAPDVHANLDDAATQIGC